MRRRIVAAVSAGAAGLALAVMPAAGAFASSDSRVDYRCSDGRDRGDRHYDCGFFDDRYDRNFDNFDNSVIIVVL